jgi:2-polyprenyl-3-methyl-5-hydroxy-6-metoxy-1,4-benzoquinol methylase
MDKKTVLLAEINADIPPGVDWHEGARRYVAAFFEKVGRPATEFYALNKPFSRLDGGGPVHTEFVAYFDNFINMVRRVKPSAGMKILDVACGGGWLSHYMTKLGCQSIGIDICEQFVELAKRRVSEDPNLSLSSAELDRMFLTHDIEAEPLGAEHRGTFDIVVLESCLHHFVDPVSAMTHICQAMKDDGVVVIIEGENRKGQIKDAWMSVMREYHTLERPYPRSQLEAILEFSGLPEREFLGQLNGWFLPGELSAQDAIKHAADAMNLCICAKTPEAIQRIFPVRPSKRIIQFGSGWWPLEAGFRWCGPYGEVLASKDVRDIELTLHGHGKAQTIVAYGPDGERARVEFRTTAQRKTVCLGNLSAGESIILSSTTAFRPSWSGSDDTRLLSFYAETKY